MGVRPSDEELLDEFTKRLCTMEFSEKQLEEANKAIAIEMNLEYLLDYLKPETTPEVMAEKRKNYKKK